MRECEVRIGNRSDALDVLQQLIDEVNSKYSENDLVVFDAGRIDGMHQALEAVYDALDRGIV